MCECVCEREKPENSALAFLAGRLAEKRCAEGSNRLFQLPRFVPQVAGFRRMSVEMKGQEKKV